MRELDDALKSLNEFESLVRYGLYPSKSLEKVVYKDQWEEWSSTYLEFRVGQLKVEALADAADRNGHLSARVWHSGKESDEECIFDLYADTEFVALTVVDYLNEYEVAA